jgi:hypothetical protein
LESGAGDSAIPDGDALGAEAAGLLGLVAGDEAAVGPHDPPPREAIDGGHDVPDGAGRPRPARLEGELAVGHDLAGLEAFHQGNHPLLELGRRAHGARRYGRYGFPGEGA